MDLTFKGRKILCLGGCYYIGLPLVWVFNHGIEAGDVLVPKILEDGCLLISLPYKPQEETRKDKPHEYNYTH